MGSEFSCMKPERGSAQASNRIVPNATQTAPTTGRASVPKVDIILNASSPPARIYASSSTAPLESRSAGSSALRPARAQPPSSWIYDGKGPVLGFGLGSWMPDAPGKVIESRPHTFRMSNRYSTGSSPTVADPSHSSRVNIVRTTSLAAIAKSESRSQAPERPRSPIKTSRSINHTLKAFTCFAGLPVEIRVIIYEYCAFLPRIVPLFYDPVNPTLHSCHPPPAILQTCKEARLQAGKFYREAFGTKTLFNLAADTIFMENHIGIVLEQRQNQLIAQYHTFRTTPDADPTSCLLLLLRRTKKEELDRIRFLAVGCHSKAFPKNVGQDWEHCGAFKNIKEKAFPNLESLTFALEINKLALGKAVENISSFEQVQDRKKEIARELEMKFLPLRCDEAWKERAKMYLESGAKYYEYDELKVVIRNLWLGPRANAEIMEKFPTLAIQNDACGRLD